MKKITINYLFMLLILQLMYIIGALTFPVNENGLTPLTLSMIYFCGYLSFLLNKDITSHNLFYKVSRRVYIINFIKVLSIATFTIWISFFITKLNFSYKELQYSFEVSLILTLVISIFKSKKGSKREKQEIRSLSEYNTVKILKTCAITSIYYLLCLIVIQKTLGFQAIVYKSQIGYSLAILLVFLNVTKIKGARFD